MRGPFDNFALLSCSGQTRNESRAEIPSESRDLKLKSPPEWATAMIGKFGDCKWRVRGLLTIEAESDTEYTAIVERFGGTAFAGAGLPTSGFILPLKVESQAHTA